MKTKLFFLAIACWLLATGMATAQEVTKRGITPPRNIRNYDHDQPDALLGQMLGVRPYSSAVGDTLLGYVPVYYLGDSVLMVGTYTVLHTGNFSSLFTGISVSARFTGAGTVGSPLELATTGVGAGTCTLCNLTFDAYGRATAKANGTVALGSQVTGTLPATNGGTGFASYAVGDLLYASATNTLARRSIGSNGQVLTVSGGVPTWQNSSSLSSLPNGNTLLGTEKIAGQDSLYTWDRTVSQIKDSLAYIDIRQYNIYPDGTDISSKFNNMLATLNTAGRASKIIIPAGTYRVDDIIVFPKSADVPIGRSIPFVFEGAGAYKRGSAAFTPVGGTIFNMNYSGADSARIIMNAATSVTFRDITFVSAGSTVDIPTMMTTHSVLTVENCAFEGNGANDKGIKLGAFTPGFTAVGTQVDAFQGYGSVIQNCYFNKLGRWIEVGTFGNDIDILNNVGWNQNNGDCAIYINDFAAAQNSVGGTITGNLFEMNNYLYGIQMISASSYVISGNGFYDHGTSAIADIRFESTAGFNTVILGFHGNAVAYSDASGTNTIIDSRQNQRSMYPQGLRTPQMEVAGAGGVSARNINTTDSDQYYFQPFSGNSVQLEYLDGGTTLRSLWKAITVSATRSDLQLLGTSDSRLTASADLRIHQASGSTLWLGVSNKVYETSGVTHFVGDAAGNIAIAIGATGAISWSGTNSSPGAAKDIGLARNAAGLLRITNGSTGTGSLTLAALRMDDGTASAPALTFNNDLNTGLYRISADILGVAVNGTEDARFSDGQMSMVLGSVGSPAYSFTGDLNNGWWSPGTDIQAWATAGVERLRIGATGSLTSSNNPNIDFQATTQFSAFVAGARGISFTAIGDGITTNELLLKNATGTTAFQAAFHEAATNGTSKVDVQAPNAMAADYVQTLSPANGELGVWLRTVATLDFPSTAVGTCSSLDVALTGVVPGDAVLPPGVFSSANVGVWSAYVFTPNNVTVRYCNCCTASAQDPSSQTFNLNVKKVN